MLAALFLAGFAVTPASAAEVDVLINKLVEKGILSKGEAGQLLNEMQKENVRQETTVKETAEKVAKETVQKEAKSGNWGTMPKWVNRIHFKGDFRLRYQYQNQENSEGYTYSRNRGRYRWRFGAVADVTKDKKWQIGFGLASGSGDPRSTNQTFANTFETPDCRIDYAYAQWQPVKYLKVIGGQMKNPIFKVKDLMWDSDIRPQGVAMPVNYAWSDKGKFFLNPALFVLNQFKKKDADGNRYYEDPIMFVFQPGVAMKISKMVSFAVSGSYYWNSDVKGNNFEEDTGGGYGTGGNTLENGVLKYNYNAFSFDGKLGFKFGGPVPGLGLFGTYVNSDADSQNVGWLAGIWFGHKDYKKGGLGTWRVKYNYRRLEADAWLDFLPDSDFYGGSTNCKGHEVELHLGLVKNVWFALDYYHAKKIDYPAGENDEPQNVLQCDFNFKF